MYLTGFADEAAQDLATQIKATKELGWNAIESRNINGKNIHDIRDADFEKVVELLDKEGVYINCFGSAVANWAKNIKDDFSITLEEVERAIPRMQRLGTKMIRIMSYARCEGEEQYKEERFKRLTEVVRLFKKAGIQPVHENCMNYGGMSWKHTHELMENVPGLKLIYDTGNSPFMKDYSKGGDVWQDSWEFYSQIKEHIAYIHIKDSLNPVDGNPEKYTLPGEGQGYVKEILKDLYESNYNGGISIEPHMATVFHAKDKDGIDWDWNYKVYVKYGQKLMELLEGMNWKWNKFSTNKELFNEG